MNVLFNRVFLSIKKKRCPWFDRFAEHKCFLFGSYFTLFHLFFIIIIFFYLSQFLFLFMFLFFSLFVSCVNAKSSSQ